MKKQIFLFLLLTLSFALSANIIMETTQGTIEIELKEDAAPLACENMKKLAEKHYYDGTVFHRVIPGFMIQGGDPNGTGRGGQSIWGKPFKDEFATGVTFNRSGVLAMANSGPNTNGSQFFITTANTMWLNRQHTIFGQVIRGYDVVKKIESYGTGSGKPKEVQKIIRLYVSP